MYDGFRLKHEAVSGFVERVTARTAVAGFARSGQRAVGGLLRCEVRFAENQLHKSVVSGAHQIGAGRYGFRFGRGGGVRAGNRCRNGGRRLVSVSGRV